MRCHICDRLLDEPHFNSEHRDFDPCESCQAVINDILNGYKDQPSADEDDLSSDPIFEGLYPPTYNPFEEENP